MCSGGGELGLGNMFDSIPAFPESGLQLIIVHVLNKTLMFFHKREKEQVIVVSNTLSNTLQFFRYTYKKKKDYCSLIQQSCKKYHFMKVIMFRFC